MSGSRTYRQYTDDAGENYTILIDESNSEATIGSTVLMPVRSGNFPPLPAGLKPRYVLATLQDDPTLKRKFKVGGVAQVSQLLQVGAEIQAAANSSSIDADGGDVRTFVVTFYSGEKRKLIPSFSGTATDTGLLDGDPD